MEEVIQYEGAVEELPEFITLHPGSTIQLPFWLEQEEIEALGCTSEVRDLGVPVVSSSNDGTTIVINVSDKRLFLIVPEPEPEPEEPPIEPEPDPSV